MIVHYCRAILLAIVLSLTTGVIAPAGAAPIPAAAAKKLAAPTLSAPKTPYVGDRLTLKGRIGEGSRRPVRLQKWNGKRFVTVKIGRCNRSGDYTFRYSSPKPRLRLRVHAPSFKRGAKQLPARTSKQRLVKLTKQVAKLTLPRTATAGETFTARVKVLRPLAGRSVKLQRHEESTWRPVDVVKTTAKGVADFQTSIDTSASTASFRAVVAKTSTRPRITSSAQIISLIVSPVPEPEPEPEPELSPVPILEVTVDEGQPITSKEDYVRASIDLDPLGSGLAPFSESTRIRVRGNSTSWISNKRSYKIKLDAKASLAGMPSNKNWALLANFYDRSMLRNAAAFELSRRVGMSWAPRMRWVELKVNGTFAGLYQLGETVTVASSRVDLPDSGTLLEADSWQDDDPQFVTGQGLQIFLKDPDDQDQSFTDAIAAQVQIAEDSLYSDEFLDPASGYRAHFAVDSFIDWYLVNELMKNVDSGFNNSIWMSLVQGRIGMAAPWDFDMSSGNRSVFAIDDPTGWFLARNWSEGPRFAGQIRDPRGHWLNRMLADPWFMQRVTDRWREVSPKLQGLPEYVAEQADLIGDAAARNFGPKEQGGAGHPIDPTFIDSKDGIYQGSWDGEVSYLTTWLRQRIAWMDEQYVVP